MNGGMKQTKPTYQDQPDNEMEIDDESVLSNHVWADE
jgi:hypothetical protein